MQKTVVVTGGTRGIGASISRALNKQGWQVAAVYHANEEGAKAFQQDTPIAVFKWDVGDFSACQDG